MIKKGYWPQYQKRLVENLKIKYICQVLGIFQKMEFDLIFGAMETV